MATAETDTKTALQELLDERQRYQGWLRALEQRRAATPAHVYERRGGGYTAQPLPGGPYTLSGLAQANGLIVLGEKVGNASAGSTVDVLMLDRRR